MTLSMHRFLTIITDIGDSGCLLVIAAAGCVYLMSRGSGRAAAFLAGAYLASAALIAMLKLAFQSCHSIFHTTSVISPSGHAAISTGVFLAYGLLMCRHLEASRRALPLIVLALLIIAITMSRVLLNYHSTEEACLGVISGLISIFLCYFFILRRKSTASFDAYALALWGVVAAFAGHGLHLPAERLIRLLALRMKSHVYFCST